MGRGRGGTSNGEDEMQGLCTARQTVMLSAASMEVTLLLGWVLVGGCGGGAGGEIFGGLCGFGALEPGALFEGFESFVAEGPLVEEEFGSADAGVGVEPVLEDVVAEEIGEGEEGHALVVSHPGADELGLATLGVVGCLVEAVCAVPAEGGHAAEVVDGVLAGEGEGEEGGVGGDDGAVFCAVFEGEGWDAPGLIAVASLGVRFGEAGF